jgi:phosphoribosyl 1,2-cyclic phosphate phosphodiesterase
VKSFFLFLGTGASSGIPEIGCHCNVCRSISKKNKRLRPSLLVKVKNKTLLIDASPDFRTQALRHHINHIDALLLTHAHYDHIGGIDDLRVFSFASKKPINCFLSEETFREVEKRFSYLFKKNKENETLSARFNFSILEEDKGEFVFQGVKINYFSYFQKNVKVLGYRIGKLAYVSDIKEYKEDIFESLKNLDVLVLSALRENFSPVQFNLEEAIAFAKEVKAKKTYFTHIAHEIYHEKILETLPENIFLAYDGLEFEL